MGTVHREGGTCRGTLSLLWERKGRLDKEKARVLLLRESNVGGLLARARSSR